jgi:hypothetical protein
MRTACNSHQPHLRQPAAAHNSHQRTGNSHQINPASCHIKPDSHHAAYVPSMKDRMSHLLGFNSHQIAIDLMRTGADLMRIVPAQPVPARDSQHKIDFSHQSGLYSRQPI